MLNYILQLQSCILQFTTIANTYYKQNSLDYKDQLLHYSYLTMNDQWFTYLKSMLQEMFTISHPIKLIY